MILIAYDITSDKLRRKIDKALCDYGIRLQYSLFRCSIDIIRQREIEAKITRLLDNNRKLVVSSDNIVVISGISSDNVRFLTKNSCITNDFMIL